MSKIEMTGKSLATLAQPLFIVMVGLPGSGKSTVAHRLMDYIEPTRICSTDNFDPKIKFVKTKGRGLMVLLDHYVAVSVMSGINVIIDQTSVEKVNRIQRLKQAPSSYIKVCIDIETSLEEYIERVSKRFKQGGRYVPERVIHELHASYEPPCISEGFDLIYLL